MSVLPPDATISAPLPPAFHLPPSPLHPSEPDHVPSALNERYGGWFRWSCARSAGTHRPRSCFRTAESSPFGRGELDWRRNLRRADVTTGCRYPTNTPFESARGTLAGTKRASVRPLPSRSNSSPPACRYAVAPVSHVGFRFACVLGPRKQDWSPPDSSATNIPCWFVLQSPNNDPHEVQRRSPTSPIETKGARRSPVSSTRQVPTSRRGSDSWVAGVEQEGRKASEAAISRHANGLTRTRGIVLSKGEPFAVASRKEGVELGHHRVAIECQQGDPAKRRQG